MTKDTKTNYSVGDFLIRIKNAAMARNHEVEIKSNKKLVAIAECLKKAKYLGEVSQKDGRLTVTLAFRDKKPVLMDLKLVSKPGLRVYTPIDEIEKKKGPSIYIISTPKGVLSSKEAVKARVGGEVLAKIL